MRVFLVSVFLFGLAWADLSCECGKRNAGRIVGGKDTKKNEYPWMVAMQKVYSSHTFCGGTIITPWHVLTAVHCVKRYQPDDLLLVVGATDVSNYRDPTRQEVLVEQIIRHPDYNTVMKNSDIALLVTSDEIIFNTYVAPACMPSRTYLDDLVGQRVKAMGWGRTDNNPNNANARFSNKLKEVDIEVKSVMSCGISGGKEFCTFSPNKNTCAGDSGGPLLWLDPETNRFTLMGVVSHGSLWCTSANGFQANVSFFKDWINTQIRNSRHSSAQTCSKI